MKYIRYQVFVFIILTMAGCANYANPTAVNGSFYMIGDSNCLRGYQNQQLANEKRILCFNKDGNITGYRNALTQQEIQMWQFNQQMAEVRNNNMMMQNQMQQMNNNMQQLNNRIMFNNLQMMNSTIY